MNAPSAKPRLDGLVLTAIGLYVLVTLTWRGVYQAIAFDESWHIFFGSVSPWTKAIQEWARDTHPPLCSILLRPLVAFSSDPIWPRLLSILPAAIQPILWFGILRKLGVQRALAYTGAILLATSHVFSDLGVVIRGYSLASMCGMAACYCLLDAFPSSKPTRKYLALGIMFAGLAFGCEYPAGMALTALVGGLLLVAWFDREFSTSVFRNLRQQTRPPERIFALLSVVSVLGFYGVTFALRELVNTIQWFPQDGQSYADFITTGFVNVLYYFTPFDLRDVPGAGWICLSGMIAVAIAGYVLARRESPLSRRRAVVFFGLVLLTVGTVALGILRKYPWGGEIRHQYMFMPFLHAVFFLSLDEATRGFKTIAKPIGVAAVAALTLACGLYVTVESRRSAFHTNEVQEGVLWDAEMRAVFDHDDTIPVMVPNCSLIGLFGPHREELNLEFVRSIDSWDLFRGGNPVRDVLRPRYLWTIHPIPRGSVLAELSKTCAELGHCEVRVFGSRFDWASIESREAMAEEATRVAREQGFEMTQRKVWEFGETLHLERIALDQEK